MNQASKHFQSQIRHRLIPAVPVPFHSSGTIDLDAQKSYANWMSSQPIAGVAVWVHTGRGLMLTASQREEVFSDWRMSLPNHTIVCGAGAIAGASSDSEYISRATTMAKQAATLGAEAILAFAPTRFRDRESAERSQLLLEYHQGIATSGLPIILFYLYESAGGVSYTDEELSALFAIESVCGIKLATLDSVITHEHPDQLLISGEDRFLGYSLMMGAESALIGMAAAQTAMQADLLDLFFASDHAGFLRKSLLVDTLSQVTFTAPMEGYIKRMLHVLAIDGILPVSSTFDPWGPALAPLDLDLVANVLTSLY
jgi:4-hydroxy-tetrahydrodipicolinate synthase